MPTSYLTLAVLHDTFGAPSIDPQISETSVDIDLFLDGINAEVDSYVAGAVTLPPVPAVHDVRLFLSHCDLIWQLAKRGSNLRKDFPVNSRDIKHLHPALQPLCLQFLANCKAAGLNVFITQTYRSTEYQNGLYGQGRTQAQLNAVGLTSTKAEPMKPKVTNALGGKSEHNATLAGVPASRAFDIAFMSNGAASWSDSMPWARAGAIGRGLGLDWGGDWKSFVDRPHFQLRK